MAFELQCLTITKVVSLASPFFLVMLLARHKLGMTWREVLGLAALVITFYSVLAIATHWGG